MIYVVLFLASLVGATAAHADDVGVNYSIYDQSGGNFTSEKSAWEVYGSKSLTDQTSLTAKGILANNHSSDGYGVGLEVGAKYKFYDSKSAINPWVQPALSYTSPESGKGSSGYVVDAGVDFKVNKFTITPAYSYQDAFTSGDYKKQTYGVKVGYAVSDSSSVYVRGRHEDNDVGQDYNRFYAGYEYRF